MRLLAICDFGFHKIILDWWESDSIELEFEDQYGAFLVVATGRNSYNKGQLLVSKGAHVTTVEGSRHYNSHRSEVI